MPEFYDDDDCIYIQAIQHKIFRIRNQIKIPEAFVCHKLSGFLQCPVVVAKASDITQGGAKA